MPFTKLDSGFPNILLFSKLFLTFGKCRKKLTQSACTHACAYWFYIYLTKRIINQSIDHSIIETIFNFSDITFSLSEEIYQVMR